MLKSIARIIAIFAAFLLLIAGGLLLAFRLMFPEHRLKSMAINGLRGFTLRDASVGRVTLGLSGLEVAGLSVSQFPNFKSGTFLSVPRLSVAFRPLALLQHRLMITAVRIDAPRLAVTLEKGGTSSFDNLVGPSHGRRYAPLALLVTDCRIVNGEVRLRDERPGGISLAARNVDVTVSNISLSGAFPVRLAADLDVRGTVHADLRGTVDVPGRTLQIAPLTLQSGTAALTVSGSIGRFADKNPVLDLRIAGDRAALDKLLQFLPWASALQFGVSSRVDVAVSGTPDNLHIRFNKI